MLVGNEDRFYLLHGKLEAFHPALGLPARYTSIYQNGFVLVTDIVAVPITPRIQRRDEQSHLYAKIIKSHWLLAMAFGSTQKIIRYCISATHVCLGLHSLPAGHALRLDTTLFTDQKFQALRSFLMSVKSIRIDLVESLRRMLGYLITRVSMIWHHPGRNEPEDRSGS